jgi:hypothetical protein
MLYFFVFHNSFVRIFPQFLQQISLSHQFMRQIYKCLLSFLVILALCQRAQAQKDSTIPSVEKKMTDVDIIIKKKPKNYQWLVFPLVLNSVETNWVFGVANVLTFRTSHKDTSSRTSSAQLVGLYTLNKQYLAILNGTVYFDREKWILSNQLSFSYFPDKFWGRGPTAEASAEEPYAFRQLYFNPHLQRRINDQLFIGLSYEFQRVMTVEYKDGGLFDKENIPGRKPYTISGLGLSITKDDRNHAFTPNRGELLQLIATYFGPQLGSAYTYSTLLIDTRKYFKIGRQSVLAVQGFGQLAFGDVPLRSLATLGGNNSMRGFYDGRFRDENQIVAQAEYRFPIAGRFGAAVFANCGDVAREVNKFTFQYLKFTAGAGLRFQLNRKENLNLRIDYGVGNYGSRGFYVELAEAF